MSANRDCNLACGSTSCGSLYLAIAEPLGALQQTIERLKCSVNNAGLAPQTPPSTPLDRFSTRPASKGTHAGVVLLNPTFKPLTQVLGNASLQFVVIIFNSEGLSRVSHRKSAAPLARLLARCWHTPQPGQPPLYIVAHGSEHVLAKCLLQSCWVDIGLSSTFLFIDGQKSVQCPGDLLLRLLTQGVLPASLQISPQTMHNFTTVAKSVSASSAGLSADICLTQLCRVAGVFAATCGGAPLSVVPDYVMEWANQHFPIQAQRLQSWSEQLTHDAARQAEERMLRKIQTDGPLKPRDLFRTYTDQRKSTLLPVLNRLLGAGLVFKDGDGRIRAVKPHMLIIDS